MAEYDAQIPRSFIRKRQVDALQVMIKLFPEPTKITFQDRFKVLYVPLGTAILQWSKSSKLVTTEFYVVNALAPEYADTNVDVVLGGAEDVEGVVANLFDYSVPCLPIFSKKLTKEQKEERQQKEQRKQQEVAQDVKDEEAAERQEREAERQKRQQQQQQQQQQQKIPP